MNTEVEDGKAFDTFIHTLIANDTIRAAAECGHAECVDNHFTALIGGREYFVSIYLNGVRADD